jgi:hypothetical protein
MLETLDAGPHSLLIGGGGGALFILEDNKSYRYNIIVVARSSSAGMSSVWDIVGGVKRAGGLTSRIGAATPPTNIANDGGASAVWTVLDTVNIPGNSLDVVVTTGGAAQTVVWMAVISWAEVLLTPA